MGRVLIWLLLFISPVVAHKASKEAQLLKKQREIFVVERNKLLEKITALEEKRREFSLLIEEKKQQVSSHQKKIENYLPLLVRLGRINPVRLLVDSSSTQNAIRGIIMIRALTSSLGHQMRLTTAALNELTSINEEFDVKTKDYHSLLQELEMQREQIKASGLQGVKDKEEQEQERLAENNDVSSLLEESQLVLSQKKKKQSTAPKAKELPFSLLEYPVVGKIVHDTSLQKTFSPQSQGIIFKTEKNADVFAPAKGVVVFRGPFLSQREILIINHGDHVHTVLMGMDKIRADVGQTVYVGEKVGSMAGYGKTAPLLYLELRKKGKPIDPLPYFVE